MKREKNYIAGKELLCRTKFLIELNANFYKFKSDTNTVLPRSLILNDKNMSTTIADYDATSARKFINRKEHNKIKFFSKVVSCSNDKRNLKIVIDLLNRIKDKLSLPSTSIEDAFSYYKKALNKNLIKGRSIKEMIVACVYIVCKKFNIPRTLRNIKNSRSRWDLYWKMLSTPYARAQGQTRAV